MATPKLCERAGVLNLTIEQGATFNPVMTWKDQNGQPIDLSGYTARMQIRAGYDATTVIHNLTTENSGIVLGGALGTIGLYISATDTAGFTFSAAVYDLELEASNGIVTRLLRGIVDLSLEVTR